MLNPDAVVWVAEGTPYEGVDYGTAIEKRLADMGLSSVRRFHRDAVAGHEKIEAKWHFMTGGETPVSETTGWMPAALEHTRYLIQEAEANRINLVGICLGSQMIAEVLAPGSVKDGTSIEVGLGKIEWNNDKTLPNLFPTFHYEEVDAAKATEAGIEILASNEHSQVQSYKYGNNIHAFQFHPELTFDDATRLVEYNRAVINEYGGNAEKTHASLEKLKQDFNTRNFELLPMFEER